MEQLVDPIVLFETVLRAEKGILLAPLIALGLAMRALQSISPLLTSWFGTGADDGGGDGLFLH